jgi:hypothetical protein
MGDAMTSRDLCVECHEASSPGGRELSESQRCECCGGQPCAGGTDFLALVTGVQKLKFMCMPCSMEYNRYVQEQLEQADLSLSPEEQLNSLCTISREADEYMKRWVSQSRSQ